MRATMARRLVRQSPVLVALCCLLPMPAMGQATRFVPLDEAARQPDFFSFRGRLLVSLARHDTAGLLNVVAPEIWNTFGDDNGAAAFRRRWRLGAADSEVWEELTAVLALGGTFENDSTFVAPYVFSRWPSRHDAFDHVAVVAKNVRVRAEPKRSAQVLAKVGFEVVRRARTVPKPLTAAQADRWEPVQLSTGRIGYIAKQFLRSPVGYRAVFVRRGHRWLMVSFVAGD